MTNNFITIREATELTGKPDITIRRLIKRLISKNNPETIQIIKQEQGGKNFIYKINKDFLLEEMENKPEEKKRQNLKKRIVEIEGELEEIKEEIRYSGKTMSLQDYISLCFWYRGSFGKDL